MFAHVLFAILFLPIVRADGWDDFSNNFATDLAPFVALFGEQLTKQFLSESTTLIDHYIFALGPIGILTAIVSTVRVAGCPAWRAFFGRAQGAGHAEAELCSSTSRDVCKLYSNGGIARVFGRAKILEVVHDSEDEDFRPGIGTAGIYTLEEYVKANWARQSRNHWSFLSWRNMKKVAVSRDMDTESVPDKDPSRFVFSPNLSLNIGIEKRAPIVFQSVAVGGTCLQISNLMFAVLVTYQWKWEKDGKPPRSYACPMVITGTLLVSLGMFLCAFIVGQSTDENLWHRGGADKSTIH